MESNLKSQININRLVWLLSKRQKTLELVTLTCRRMSKSAFVTPDDRFELNSAAI